MCNLTRSRDRHTTSDDAELPLEKTPTINGKTQSPEAAPEPTKDAQNSEAFTANSTLPEPTLLEPLAEPVSEESTMADVNGAPETASVPAAELKQDPVADAPAKKAPSDSVPTKEASPIPAVESAADDSMELDESAERPDLSSSIEHAESTQETSAVSGSIVVSSPQELSQSADVSKLDIKSTQDEELASQQDVPMSDRQDPPAKVSRERDEDITEEPAAKRAKVEEEQRIKKAETQSDKAEDSIGVATGLSPAPAGSLDAFEDDIPSDMAISEFQRKEIRKELARLKKTKNGNHFRQSVERLWPALWDSYSKVVEQPVDISYFESKFRDNKYTTFGDFKADLRLLHGNAVQYNGPDNAITIAALHVKNEILKKLKEIIQHQEPARAEKAKTQPTRHSEPRAATQPRRQSHSQPRPSASSPKPKPESAASAAPAASSTPVATSAPAFALPPNGVPQIRRDSTRDDGDRPKRPIHPPKNRDLDYQKNGRKKKLEPEMKFYGEVLTDVKRPRYWTQNQWFLEPVDPVALNIPTYFSIVKKPMSLKEISLKLEQGDYRTGKEIEKDLHQIVANSELFNGHDSPVTAAGHELEALFKDKVAEKDTWMARNYPPSVTASAPSPEASDHDSEVESEAEVEEEEPESIRNLQTRFTEEQDKLNTLLAAKKPDMTMIEIQQNVVSLLQRKLVEERAKVGEAKKPKPKKKTTKTKAKAGSSNITAAGGSSKKATGSAAAAPKKSTTSHKKGGPKKRVIGPFEKAVIAEGINELDGPMLLKAVEIIKKDTNQKVSSTTPCRKLTLSNMISFQEDDDGQLELDIEVLSQDALNKLYDVIMKAYPAIHGKVIQRPEFRQDLEEQQQQPKPKTSTAPKPKKNKPMNKHEQERNIEKLRELKAQFQRHGSGSQEPIPGEGEEQRPGDSSEEEEESDSEEE